LGVVYNRLSLAPEDHALVARDELVSRQVPVVKSSRVPIAPDSWHHIAHTCHAGELLVLVDDEIRVRLVAPVATLKGSWIIGAFPDGEQPLVV
jgi:hypothetical protein